MTRCDTLAEDIERRLKGHHCDRIDDVLTGGSQVQSVAVGIRKSLPKLADQFRHDHPIPPHSASQEILVEPEHPAGFGNRRGRLSEICPLRAWASASAAS